MGRYILKETDDFFSLSTLFHNSGMGVKIEERCPDRIIKMWRMDDEESGELIAAVTLEVRDNVFTLGDIAVKEEFHRMGYGKVLLGVVFDEAEKRNIKELWACAKEPEFYLHNGWEKAAWEDSPNIAIYCTDCEKRNIHCHPEIMKYTLQR
ncbi:MAG: GNAT family N-acetyltransferase [Clostridia bacterium]|nr:GNAT family N-acetyltransferase [Clostridia bacterium]